MSSKSSVDIEEPYCPYTEYLNSTEHSDVRVTVDGETFHCHKIILAKRIPYFEGALNFDATRAVVDLKEDIRASGFKVILGWAYTGKYTISADNVADVIEASCYLHVDNICDKCVKYLENSGRKEQLVDIFFVTLKYDLNKVARRIRNRIMVNLKESVIAERLVNMTQGELKLLLFFEKGLPKKVADKVSVEEVAAVHPKLFLTAIIEWACSDESHLTGATDLLNSLDLMRIHTDDIKEVCGKHERIIEVNPVVFSPLLSRFLKENNPFQLYVPRKLTRNGKKLYVASGALDFLTINSFWLDSSLWSPYESNGRLTKVVNRFANAGVIGFGVYGGTPYFLTHTKTTSAITGNPVGDLHNIYGNLIANLKTYHIRKLENKIDPRTRSFYWDWVNIELPMQDIHRVEFMNNRTEEFSIMVWHLSGVHISSWSDNGWTTERVADNEKNHYLLRFSGNRTGKQIAFCSVPITQIPKIPNLSSLITAVCTSKDEIYAFASDPISYFVFDANKRIWNPLPPIPFQHSPVKLAANINGKIIVILESKQTYHLDCKTKSWIHYSNVPNGGANDLLSIGC